jgi:hypothetical protein
MPPDFVQIGPFIISRVVFDTAVPLVSVVIGGLITYLTTRAIENRKWEQQKKDKLQEQRREAIGLALEWIAPIESAVTRASLLTSSFIKKTISEDEFRSRWPDLISVLARKDIPVRLSVLLPPNTYERGIQITMQLEELQAFSLISEPIGKTTVEEWTKRFDSVTHCIASMQQTLTALNHELTEEYKRTFQ